MTITETAAPNDAGYQTFSIGGFTFSRDEYFATITWPTGTHQIAIDVFLRALQRDVAWGFFYGIVNFDAVFGTMNHYGNVDMFAGRFNDAYRRAEVDYNENFTHDDLMACFQSILKDWTNEGYDPFAAPMETGQPFGRNKGSNDAAVTRRRVVAKRMVSVPGDEQIRTDESGYHDQPRLRRRAAGRAGRRGRAGLRGRGVRLQPVRLHLALRRHVEPVGGVGVQGVAVLPDVGGVHPPGDPRQRPRASGSCS